MFACRRNKFKHFRIGRHILRHVITKASISYGDTESSDRGLACEPSLTILLITTTRLTCGYLGGRHSFIFKGYASFSKDFPGGSVLKNLPAKQETTHSIPGSGRSPKERDGNPLQYSCLGNPMDRGAYWAKVHVIAKLSDQFFKSWVNTHNNTYSTIFEGEIVQDYSWTGLNLWGSFNLTHKFLFSFYISVQRCCNQKNGNSNTSLWFFLGPSGGSLCLCEQASHWMALKLNLWKFSPIIFSYKSCVSLFPL